MGSTKPPALSARGLTARPTAENIGAYRATRRLRSGSGIREAEDRFRIRVKSSTQGRFTCRHRRVRSQVQDMARSLVPTRHRLVECRRRRCRYRYLWMLRRPQRRSRFVCGRSTPCASDPIFHRTRPCFWGADASGFASRRCIRLQYPSRRSGRAGRTNGGGARQVVQRAKQVPTRRAQKAVKIESAAVNRLNRARDRDRAYCPRRRLSEAWENPPAPSRLPWASS